MTDGAKIADVDDVPPSGSYLFTAADAFTNETELILVRCEEEPGIQAWPNTCTHQQQAFDRGDGAAIRDGQLVCPRHGSLFDACAGTCDNGPAAGTELSTVEVTVEDGSVFLSDDNYTFRHAGGTGDDDPASTSHISF
ncbi:Rieske (2Fe-2S) protein [Halobellus clavatus]|jgi:nitrite reductase/ring-hydroxylating ferredoxin subunit|uniref:Ferredoxin subunit of nitrite reductase or a ring-hydroxylating dioxygenase n=1 Tax=Halobellus clavatus TaxID=660517 RepID=A0A1H3DEI7_9EURY|nr:Rieske (2Fe-2S) protein [Halobellus clavatus]SDX64863.1 Ferredoxin subunit of nitrite reductase or a ring-hydroxylating dioxygenase [Halobellus clavatus]